MPIAVTTWQATWPKPWPSAMDLDSPPYQGFTWKGAFGVWLRVDSFTDADAITIPAQTWQTGLRPDSATIVISRAGTSGAVINISVSDTDNAVVGSVSPTNYPPGITTITIPLLMGTADLAYLSMWSSNYPTPIDATILDVYVGASELKPEWTHHIGCMEF